MSSQLTLNAQGSVTLDANGNGQVALGPTLPGTSWSPTSAAVQCDTNENEAYGSLYLGLNVTTGTLLGTTQTASTGDSTDIAVPVWPGQSLIFAWSGGDPGTIATLSIVGERTVP